MRTCLIKALGDVMTSKSSLSNMLVAALSLLFLITSSNSRTVQDLNITANESGLIPRQPSYKSSRVSVSPEANISHVVVKFSQSSGARLRGNRLVAKTGRPMQKSEAVLRPYIDNHVKRLFANFSEEKLDRDRLTAQTRTGHEMADLNSYFQIDVTDPSTARQLVERLNALEEVEIAYIQPMPEVAGDIDPPTPDYQPDQDYREAAPVGIDADYANSLPGGDGTGVKIIDIEINWQTTHEDLDKAVGAVIGPYPGENQSSTNHGTAVLGEMVAGNNGYGVTGICYGADVGMVSVSTMSTAQALYTAIDNLNPGDMILIELHAPGPRYDFQPRTDQKGYVCMEYWQANFDAIQYAWANGIIVMEAAGNGAEDFDDVAMYGQLFDTTWRNSHAIIIGAGYPWSSGINLQKHGFSNYGERVNLQGYGSGVYSCGYGSIFTGGGDWNQYYTGTFSGTSSASPIVTGAGACLQGYYMNNYGAVMTSDMIRDILVATGTPQTGDTTEHIGPRPDLQAAINALSPPPSIYALPILIDTTLDAGSFATTEIWLYNRSISEAIDFSVIENDSLGKMIGNWMAASPSSGTIPPAGSFMITVTLDASVVPDQVGPYIGLLTFEWGLSGGSLDSSTVVPVYMTVPCNDTTYIATKSTDPGGPVFDWISARTLGTKLPYELFYHQGSGDPLDDGSTGPKNIGFQFPFYDTSFNRLFIGVNGGVSFTDTNVNINGYFGGIDIPGSPFETFIGAFWSDLIFDTVAVPQSGIYFYNTPGYDTLVIEWYRPSNFNLASDTTIDFELILTRWGEIIIQYLDVGISGLEQSALTGLAEVDCRGLSYVSNGTPDTNVVSNGLAVRFFYSGREIIQSGNVDGLGEIDISDLVWLVDYMFNSGPEPIPYESGDVNCSGGVLDIADLVLLIDWMFNSGPAPCYFVVNI